MIITVTLLVSFIGLLFAYIWTSKSRHGYFQRRNIPGPPPKFFFGNYLSMWSTPDYQRQIQSWTQQYGSMYGIFEGSRPIYVVSDVDFLQEVYIKQFSSFHSRRNNFLVRLMKTNGASLFSAHANEWRRQRHVINPTFSSGKLKAMTPLMNKCIKSMMTTVANTNGDEFNIYPVYKRLTMDVICK
jgi:cytochrome P450